MHAEIPSTQFVSIEHERDIRHFLKHTNGLHDGYLIGVQYTHSGHTGGNPHMTDNMHNALTLRILVTSLCDAVVEIVFRGVSEWRIKDDQWDMTDAALCFTKDGAILWADDVSLLHDRTVDRSYVVAESMKWRII